MQNNVVPAILTVTPAQGAVAGSGLPLAQPGLSGMPAAAGNLDFAAILQGEAQPADLDTPPQLSGVTPAKIAEATQQGGTRITAASLTGLPSDPAELTPEQAAALVAFSGAAAGVIATKSGPVAPPELAPEPEILPAAKDGTAATGQPTDEENLPAGVAASAQQLKERQALLPVMKPEVRLEQWSEGSDSGAVFLRQAIGDLPKSGTATPTATPAAQPDADDTAALPKDALPKDALLKDTPVTAALDPKAQLMATVAKTPLTETSKTAVTKTKSLVDLDLPVQDTPKPTAVPGLAKPVSEDLAKPMPDGLPHPVSRPISVQPTTTAQLPPATEGRAQPIQITPSVATSEDAAPDTAPTSNQPTSAASAAALSNGTSGDSAGISGLAKFRALLRGATGFDTASPQTPAASSVNSAPQTPAAAAMPATSEVVKQSVPNTGTPAQAASATAAPISAEVLKQSKSSETVGKPVADEPAQPPMQDLTPDTSSAGRARRAVQLETLRTAWQDHRASQQAEGQIEAEGEPPQPATATAARLQSPTTAAPAAPAQTAQPTSPVAANVAAEAPAAKPFTLSTPVMAQPADTAKAETPSVEMPIQKAETAAYDTTKVQSDLKTELKAEMKPGLTQAASAPAQPAAQAPAQAMMAGAEASSQQQAVQAMAQSNVTATAEAAQPQAASQPAPMARSLMMTDREWPTQLTAMIKEARDLTQGDIEIALQPERLGRMTIRMEMRDNQVSVSILTDNDASARLLNDNQGKLADLMTKAGLDLTQHNASSGQQGREQAGLGQNAGGNSGNGQDPNGDDAQLATAQVLGSESANLNEDADDSGIDILA